MSIHLNGETRVIDEGLDVADLIGTLGLAAPAVLVEHNGLALRRDEWSGRSLVHGDQVEIIRIVAGG